MLNVDEAWRAVANRDSSYGGRFLYGVSTTNVYCRPGCASRMPRRRNVRFFEKAREAESAGFRPCKRCRPNLERHTPSAVRGIERARAYLDAHLDEKVTLERLAATVHMSRYHLQRTFKRHIGLTPREYVEARRADRLKQRLREGDTVSRATFEAGYPSVSRVYDQAEAQLGMTPASYRSGGEGLRIRFAITATPLGRILVAATDLGLCMVALGDDDGALRAELRAEYPRAQIEPAEHALSEWVESIVAYLSGETQLPALPLDVQATVFQRRVWKALQEIPHGATRSYGEIAERIGEPGAARAVARACASNRVALVVPCHRVVRQNGALSGYRWGVDRKARLLRMEADTP